MKRVLVAGLMVACTFALVATPAHAHHGNKTVTYVGGNGLTIINLDPTTGTNRGGCWQGAKYTNGGACAGDFGDPYAAGDDAPLEETTTRWVKVTIDDAVADRIGSLYIWGKPGPGTSPMDGETTGRGTFCDPVMKLRRPTTDTKAFFLFFGGVVGGGYVNCEGIAAGEHAQATTGTLKFAFSATEPS